MILIYCVAMQSRHCTRKWSSTKQKKTTKLTNYSDFHISIRFCMKKRYSTTTATITAYRFFYVPEWWRASISTKWIFIHDTMSAAPFLSCCMILLWTFTLKNRKKIHVNLNGAIFATFFSMLGSQCTLHKAICYAHKQYSFTCCKLGKCFSGFFLSLMCLVSIPIGNSI